MGTARTPGRLRPRARTFRDGLREFLTPAVWKQAHQAHPPRRRGARWTDQSLILVGLFAAWCCGDSIEERFETARAFTVVCLPKRKRPGRTVQGFRKATARLPMPALRAVAGGVRDRLAAVFGGRWAVDGFVPLGCDGSRLECPRARELEDRLRPAGKDGSAPTLWVTALVHLRLGLLWGWRLGKGTASERHHLLHRLPILPANTLLVADAGYVGFEVAWRLHQAGHAFVIRMSSTVTLYTERAVRLDRYREGRVYYWPPAGTVDPQPLRARLIRVRSRKAKHDVWLLTNVLDADRLSARSAGQFYRWRWENEGFFRTYKRTLAKVKLHSRTVRLVHREAESSLLATQLLLAQGAAAIRSVAGPGPAEVTSARQVLRRIRREMAGAAGSGPSGRFREQLGGATRERRERSSAKEARVWPRRGPHKPPKPPKLLTLTAEQKAVIRGKKHDSS
jgi:hypothetical protein